MSATKAKSFWKSHIITLPPRTIVLPNGNTIISREGIVIPYTLGTWTSQLEARLVDIQGYDVILGLSWLIKHNPNINWSIGTVNLTHGDTLEPTIVEYTSKIFSLKNEDTVDVIAALHEPMTPATSIWKALKTWPLVLLAMQKPPEPVADPQDP